MQLPKSHRNDCYEALINTNLWFFLSLHNCGAVAILIILEGLFRRTIFWFQATVKLCLNILKSDLYNLVAANFLFYNKIKSSINNKFSLMKNSWFCARISRFGGLWSKFHLGLALGNHSLRIHTCGHLIVP